MVKRLVAMALLEAMHHGKTPEAAARSLAALAHGHPEMLDRAIAHIHRNEDVRSTVSVEAARSLQLARGFML